MRFFLAVFLFVFSLVYSAPVEARVIVIRRSIPITYPVSTFGLSCDPGLSGDFQLSSGYGLSNSFGLSRSYELSNSFGYGLSNGVGLYGANSGFDGEIIRERKIRRPRPRPRPTLIIRGRDVFVP